MNLIGTVINAGRPFVPIIKGQNGIIGHAEPAVDLQRSIDYLLHHIGNDKFYQRDLFAGLFFPNILNHPGSVEHHQTGALDVGRTFGNP